MNDEIKEILDNFKIYEDRYKKCNETQFIIFYKDIHLLLDYITNLQKENERLNTNLGELQNAIDNIAELVGIPEGMSVEDVYDKVKDYKSRLDKAVEYITSYEAISTIQGLDRIEQNKTLDERTTNVMVERYLQVHHNLLNILQNGSDEE